MTKTKSSIVAALLALLALLAAPASAQEMNETTAQCVSAYQAAQELRLDGKLSSARERAAFCSQEQCPNAVRSGCTKWLAELIEAQPSIAITARGEEGKDISDVRVIIDGRVAAESLTGRAVEIDPGKHTVRFEHAGRPPIEREIIISEGVKNRPIPVDFAPPADRARPGPAAVAPPRSLTGPILLGGLGAASLGVFALLGATGSAELDEMRRTCGVTHTCTEDRIDGARTKLVVGDVFLAAGVVEVGAAVVWYFVGRPGDPSPEGAPSSIRALLERPRARIALGLEPRREGASARMTLTF